MIQERAKQLMWRLFSLNDTPERIALAFAVGVFLAFSPFLGFHTFLGLFCTFAFGLNRIALFAGVFVNNPWTLVPIYAASAYLGGILLGFPTRPELPSFEWSALFSSSFWVQLASQWPVLKPVLLGSTILSFVTAACSYAIALRMIRRLRARRVPAP